VHNKYVKKSSSVINLSVSLKAKSEKTSMSMPDLIDVAEIGISIPEGFVVTPNAYTDFLSANHLSKKITDLLSTVHYERPDSLMQVATHIKNLVHNAALPQEFIDEIEEEYTKLGAVLKKPTVFVGGKIANNLDEVLEIIKENWLSRFDAKKLLYLHLHKKSLFENIPSIYVLKTLPTKKKGELYTSSIHINSDADLTPSEISKLKEIGQMLKKYFYFPLIVPWVIEKGNIFVVDLIPMTNTQKTYLVLVRHGTSEYNEKGLWAGWDDPSLTEKGEQDAIVAANTLKDIHLDLGFASPLIRHNMTLSLIKKALKRNDLKSIISKDLMERNYGDFTGMNKWEVEKQMGKEEFMKLRRGWDYPIPNGESLKDVYDRVIPYYKENILPKLKGGKNIIVSSSGNALRSLVKYLEEVSDEDISKVEIAPGEVYVYQIDEDGNVVSKEIRNQQENRV
jgi:2,3-bisphosphoglycerate-dependent phosphoglycerate mutase